jgi:citrate synthase
MRFDTHGLSDIVLQSPLPQWLARRASGSGREEEHADRQAGSRQDGDRCGFERQNFGPRPRPRRRPDGPSSFTEFFFFAATGRAPTEDQRFFLDLALIAIAEHGLTPSVQAARMTYAADPAALQGAVAAGVLGCGTVILGAADLCRALIDDVLARVPVSDSLSEAALAVARERHETRRPIPGYGHPLHKPVDPRAEKMIALAQERGAAGRSVAAAVALTNAVAQVWGKPLPMNVSMAIAATLRDVDVPPGLIRAVPILARTAGLIAHLIEEQETPIGFYLASKGEEAIAHTAALGDA